MISYSWFWLFRQFIGRRKLIENTRMVLSRKLDFAPIICYMFGNWNLESTTWLIWCLLHVEATITFVSLLVRVRASAGEIIWYLGIFLALEDYCNGFFLYSLMWFVWCDLFWLPSFNFLV
jgi:hypothetical protein